jgi:hypothetical protein
MTGFIYSPKETLDQYHRNLDFFKNGIESGDFNYEEALNDPYGNVYPTFFHDNFIGTRNSLLLITDWTQLETNHLSLSERESWANWRQELRNLPSIINITKDTDYLNVVFPYPNINS